MSGRTPEVGFHDGERLAHERAGLRAEAARRQPIELVSRELGHSDVRVTSGIYSHLLRAPARTELTPPRRWCRGVLHAQCKHGGQPDDDDG
jgi:hypothetical protein